MPFISSFEIIKIVIPELCISSWIPASISEAAAGIPNWANFAYVTATFINGPAIILNNAPKNPPDWILLDVWVVGNFISADMVSNAFFTFFLAFFQMRFLSCCH